MDRRFRARTAIGRAAARTSEVGVDSGRGRNDTLSILSLPLVAFTGIVRAFDAERRENAHLSGLPVPFHDVDGILADSEFTGDPAVTSSFADGLKDLGRKLGPNPT